MRLLFMKELQYVFVVDFGFFAWPLLVQAISLPKDSICIPLDGLVGVSSLQSFCRPAAVFTIEFNATEMTIEFSRNDSRCATPKKWIKYKVVGLRACKYKLRYQFFGFLSWVVGVLWHRPEGNSYV